MIKPFAAALVLGWTLSMAAMPAQAALLLQQAPVTTADAVVVGSDGQALLPAETFDIASPARTLSWWGSFGVDFAVTLYALTDLGAPLRVYTPSYSGLAAAGSMSIDGLVRDIYRFELDLGTDLAAGAYAVSIGELTADPAIVETWYWVRGSGGDGSSRYGVDDFAGGRYGFDLSLQLDGAAQVVPEPSTGLLLLAAGVAWSLRGRLLCREA